VTTFPVLANATAYTDIAAPTGSTFTSRVGAVKGSTTTWSGAVSVSTSSAGQDIINQYAFQYKYDERKRMIAKKVPGADWVYMVYDTRDRVVLTQDGNQRAKRNNNCEALAEWTFTKYDALNRPVLTGVYRSNSTRETLQNDVNGFYQNENGDPLNPMFEVRGTVVHGYTNQSFPSVGNSDDYYTVTYYDDNTFMTLLAGDQANYAYRPC